MSLFGKKRTRLSVNLNKVALLRNARAFNSIPHIAVVALSAISAGCDGLTVHPRADGRHAVLDDIRTLSMLPQVVDGLVEINVEGDYRSDLMSVVKECKVDQFTLVPVRLGEKTTERGWSLQEDGEQILTEIADALSPFGIRLSLFVDAIPESVYLASKNGFGAVEFHTKDYADAYMDTFKRNLIVSRLKKCSSIAVGLGLRVNLGHDLNLENLGFILDAINPDEVSIGHSLISDVIMEGIAPVVKRYSNLCKEGFKTPEPDVNVII